MKMLNLIGSLKSKVDLLFAFASGAVVGYSAGVGIKVLDKVLDCRSDSKAGSETGISRARAEDLKESLENEPSSPETVAAGA